MTPLQRCVAQVWSEVLGVGLPTLGDNFTELGGHSLHAVRTVFRLRQQLGVSLSLTAFFEAVTLEDLCVELERAVPRVKAA